MRAGFILRLLGLEKESFKWTTPHFVKIIDASIDILLIFSFPIFGVDRFASCLNNGRIVGPFNDRLHILLLRAAVCVLVVDYSVRLLYRVVV